MSSPTISLTSQFATFTASTAAPTKTSMFDTPPPESLTLTHSPKLEQTLGDVPFFCIGVLAFAMMIFCLATRRINKPFAYILASAMVAFSAAVVDLNGLLNGNPSNIFALLVAREMGYAASIGLRFFFFWVYAGRRPEFEAASLSSESDAQSTTASNKTHSASWGRWGLVGLTVQYMAFLGCFIIMVLQMIWRFGALFKLSKFIVEYRAAAIMEISISTIFLLKFGANAYGSSCRPRIKLLSTLGPAMFALLVQVGVAIGNLIVVRFSETCLGRLLQSLVMFTIIISLLISAVLDVPVPSARTLSPEPERPNRTSSFQGLNLRASLFRGTPQGSSGLAPPIPGSTTASPKPGIQRRTTAERFSQWVSSRVTGRATDDQERLWDQQRFTKVDLEKNAGNQELTTVSDDMSPMGPQQQELNLASSLPSMTSRMTSRIDANETAEALPQFARQSAMELGMPGKEDIASPSKRSSYYVDDYRYTLGGAESLHSSRIPRAPQMADRVDSPVYGLSGIMRNLAARNGLEVEQDESIQDAISKLSSDSKPIREDSPATRSLLRQQTELEQSVRSLQMFSPTSTNATVKPSRMSILAEQSAQPVPRLMAPPANPPPSSLNRMTSATIGAESVSASVTSEFSLGDFPSPPAVLKPMLADSESSTDRKTPEWDERYSFVPRPLGEAVPRASVDTVTQSPPNPAHGRSISVDDVPFSLVPPRMPAAAQESLQRQMSFPSTTRGSDMSALFEQSSPVLKTRRPSDGKRIDVTSFIGGLSHGNVPGSAGGASHYRQDSDKSKRTVQSSVILEEGETPSSVPPSSAEIKTPETAIVRRISGSARARLIDAVREMGASSPVTLAYDDELPKPVVVPEPRPVVRRQANALPFSPKPSSAAAARSASSSPVQRLRGTAVQISSPLLAAEEPKSFERPRPPPLALGGLKRSA